MNCNDAQHAILLEQSGELPTARQSVLGTHLMGCAACRTYQDDLTRMLAVSRTTPLEEQVSEFTVRNIEAAADRNLHPAGTRRAGGRVVDMWRPTLIAGAAAVLVLLLTITYIRRDTEGFAGLPEPDDNGADALPAGLLAWDPPLEDEFESLNTLLAMSIEDDSAQENADSLDHLAEELIELENWSI